MVTLPSLTIESLGGLFGSSIKTPFFLCGLVQYFSKIPSLIQVCRDRVRDSARTPLVTTKGVSTIFEAMALRLRSVASSEP